MSILGPVDHLARHPLPWRTTADLTECGKPITDHPGRVITRDEVAQRIRDWGQKRAAFSTCMTCATTSTRWAQQQRRRPGHDTIGAVAREAGAVEHAYPPIDPAKLGGVPHTNHERTTDLWARHERLTRELEAVAALVAAHREEFDAYLAGLADTVNLAERRRRGVAR